MLKLYYAGATEPIVVGYINRDNLLVQSSANENTRLKLSSMQGAPEIRVAFVLAATGSGFQTFISQYTNITEMFLDSGLNMSAGIAIAMNGSDAVFMFKSDSDWIPYDAFRTTDGYELASVYSSATDLTNNNEEWKYFVREMITEERDMVLGDSRYNGPGLGYSCLTSPFVPVDVGVANFVYRPLGFQSVSLPVNLRLIGSSMISAATLYYCFSGNQLIKTDKMTLKTPDGGVVEFNPAVMYNPLYVNKNSFTYAYGNISPQGAQGYSTKVTLQTPVTIGDYTITSYSQFLGVFTQKPSVTFDGSIVAALPDLQYSGFTVRWGMQAPNLFNQLTGSISAGEKRFYYTQINDSANFSAVCGVQYPESTAISNISTGELPCPPIALCRGQYSINSSGVVTTGSTGQACSLIWYAYETNVGMATGNDLLRLFYNGKVQEYTPDVPDYNIPDDTGGGGVGDDDYQGGDGTWSEDDTDTSIDPNVAPSVDPYAPMPDDIGLEGNYYIVKLNNAGMIQLANQSWTDDSWLKHISLIQGTSRIGEGILDVKTCFVDIPAISTGTVSAIAGYTLQEPIACNIVNQYTQYTFGYLEIPKYTGTYLDYSPYSEYTLELPFAQPVKIPPELIVGDILQIILRVDVMSSTALYIIQSSKHMIAQVPADIFVSLPFGSSEYTMSRNAATLNAIQSIGTAVGTGVAASVVTGGAAAPIALAGVALSGAATINNQEESRNITQISNGGGPGSVGAMGVKTAILKVSHPYVVIPDGYYEYTGAPSGYIKNIRDCTGYFEVETLYGRINCNEDEYDKLVAVLSSGVYP